MFTFIIYEPFSLPSAGISVAFNLNLIRSQCILFSPVMFVSVSFVCCIIAVLYVLFYMLMKNNPLWFIWINPYELEVTFSESPLLFCLEPKDKNQTLLGLLPNWAMSQGIQRFNVTNLMTLRPLHDESVRCGPLLEWLKTDTTHYLAKRLRSDEFTYPLRMRNWEMPFKNLQILSFDVLGLCHSVHIPFQF